MNGGVTYSDLVNMEISGIIEIYQMMVEAKNEEAKQLEEMKQTNSRKKGKY